jgi:hypothetical protein
MPYRTLDNSDPLGEQFLHPDGIVLDDETLAWAARQSQTVDPTQAWATYLTLLASIGVRQWLQQRSPRLAASAHDPLADPLTLPLGAAIARLVVISCLEDGSVELPNDALDPTQPLVYLVVDVLEELNQVQVRGFLPQTTLLHRRANAGATGSSISIPIDWFDLDLDRLLLHSEFGTLPTAIAAPHAPTSLQNAVINGAHWLQDQLDDIAAALGWLLLPSFSYSPALRALRSPIDHLDGILGDLTRHQAITIPATARAATHDISIDATLLRLYVVLWELPTAGNDGDWNLLVILSAPPDTLMPLGTSLQIRDDQTLLVDTALQDSSGTFLYAQLAGIQQEQFWIRVISPTGLQLALPPITFQP